MACYHPIKGYRSRTLNVTGRRSIVFSTQTGYADLPVSLPCGQCIGCRLEYSRQWAIRCHHEASLHKQNAFITLTYSPEHLPEGGTLVLKHYQDFMKRFRKKYTNKTIRFFHCGEYGDKNGRPHYHACIFGHDFDDKVLYQTREGINLYTSEILQKLWGHGFVTTGDVTFDSAAYVARYITKKVTGKLAADHYERVDPETGELFQLKPEYVTMSRNPGIAYDWFKQYSSDVYPDDHIVINNKKMRPPKYYDTILEQTHSDLYEEIKTNRTLTQQKNRKNQTAERLLVRETVQKEKLKQLPRSL